MRSELVFAAKHTLSNRYTLCRVVSTSTRKFHIPNTRVEDTTDAVLRRVANLGVDGVSLGGRDVFEFEGHSSWVLPPQRSPSLYQVEYVGPNPSGRVRHQIEKPSLVSAGGDPELLAHS